MKPLCAYMMHNYNWHLVRKFFWRAQNFESAKKKGMFTKCAALNPCQIVLVENNPMSKTCFLETLFPAPRPVVGARIVAWDDNGKLRQSDDVEKIAREVEQEKRNSEMRRLSSKIQSARQALEEAKKAGDSKAARSQQARINCYAHMLKRVEKEITAALAPGFFFAQKD